MKKTIKSKTTKKAAKKVVKKVTKKTLKNKRERYSRGAAVGAMLGAAAEKMLTRESRNKVGKDIKDLSRAEGKMITAEAKRFWGDVKKKMQ